MADQEEASKVVVAKRKRKKPERNKRSDSHDAGGIPLEPLNKKKRHFETNEKGTSHGIQRRRCFGGVG
jgi:hypothetical protein